MFLRAGYVLRKLTLGSRFFSVWFLGIFFLLTSGQTLAQVPTFAGNAQHTSIYTAPAQNLNVIKWSKNIDFNNTSLVHYGSPLVTAGNTILTPVKLANDSFRVDAVDGATGAGKYVLSTDYILPAHSWIPEYNPCITTGSFGTRLYFAGAGGTIWHIDNPDSNSPAAAVREAFYPIGNYSGNVAGFNSTVFVNTPITADAAGNIYFGFRVQGTAPAPLNTTQSGFARIDANGNGSYVLAGTAANDSAISVVSHNLAPAFSNDGSTLYVVVKASNNTKSYLLGLDPGTFATKYSVVLTDPRNGNPANVNDNGTAAPMVGPDGDVYFGVLGNPGNGSRGFLLHFNGNLTITKTPGAFGWDYTAGVVPASAVPSYTGTSSYLLFCKYNDYPSTISGVVDAVGVNRVALLDPNATQIDPHPSAGGLVEMREVLTVIGPTPDPDNPGLPNAVKEWCINAPAVNPATNSVFFTSEDGRSYRWNLVTNTLDQAVVLTPGILEPYVPTVIGPDGTVYTLNGGTLFALGSLPGVNVVINSSAPDLRNAVVGSAITFTASVTGSPAGFAGTVTFTDLTYNGTTAVTTTLASNVPLNSNGEASVTTSSLVAAGAFHGNHLITAAYSGDTNHSASSATMLQKIHANASSTLLTSTVNPANFGQAVTFTATVSAVPSGAGTPTGMVTFQDGLSVIGQVPLSSGAASITRSNLTIGSHTITAIYASDTQFAASSATVTQVVQNGTITAIASSLNPSSVGQSVMFTATVTQANAAPGTATGSVTFREGSTVLATAALDSNGRASFITSALTAGSHTISADFTGTNGWLNSSGSVVQSVESQTAPFLLTDVSTGRAAALDLVWLTRDPFTLTNPYNLSTDLRRRVSLFVWRLGLLPGASLANVVVTAEDDQGATYNLPVEYIGQQAPLSEVSQVVVRLPDNVVGAPRDLQVKVSLQGTVSNKAVIKIAAP